MLNFSFYTTTEEERTKEEERRGRGYVTQVRLLHTKLTSSIENFSKMKKNFFQIFHPPAHPPNPRHISSLGLKIKNPKRQSKSITVVIIHAKFQAIWFSCCFWGSWDIPGQTVQKWHHQKFEEKNFFSNFVHFWCGGTSWDEIHSYQFFLFSDPYFGFYSGSKFCDFCDTSILNHAVSHHPMKAPL